MGTQNAQFCSMNGTWHWYPDPGLDTASQIRSLNPHDPSQSSKKSIRRAELELLYPQSISRRIREPVGYPVHAALPAAPALTSTSCVIGVRVALPQVLGADGDVFDLPWPITSGHAHGDCKADGVETPRGPGVCRESTWGDNRPADSHSRAVLWAEYTLQVTLSGRTRHKRTVAGFSLEVSDPGGHGWAGIHVEPDVFEPDVFLSSDDAWLHLSLSREEQCCPSARAFLSWQSSRPVQWMNDWPRAAKCETQPAAVSSQDC